MTKVLIVDDDTRLGDSLSREVIRLGYEARYAESAEAALEVLAREAIDVVVTDLRMSQQSGIELIDKARRIAPKSRAILMSGWATAEDYKTATKIGAVDVLVKPFEPEQLATAIEKALGCVDGVQATVHGLSLVDILQAFGMARRSVTLEVGDGARIFVKDGQVIHAETQDMKGPDAFREIITSEAITLDTTPLEECEKTIDQKLDALLLDVFVSEETPATPSPDLGNTEAFEFFEPVHEAKDVTEDIHFNGGFENDIISIEERLIPAPRDLTGAAGLFAAYADDDLAVTPSVDLEPAPKPESGALVSFEQLSLRATSDTTPTPASIAFGHPSHPLHPVSPRSPFIESFPRDPAEAQFSTLDVRAPLEETGSFVRQGAAEPSSTQRRKQLAYLAGACIVLLGLVASMLFEGGSTTEPSTGSSPSLMVPNAAIEDSKPIAPTPSPSQTPQPSQPSRIVEELEVQSSEGLEVSRGTVRTTPESTRTNRKTESAPKNQSDRTPTTRRVTEAKTSKPASDASKRAAARFQEETESSTERASERSSGRESEVKGNAKQTASSSPKLAPLDEKKPRLGIIDDLTTAPNLSTLDD